MKSIKGNKILSFEEIFEIVHTCDNEEILIENMREEENELYNYLNNDFEHNIFYVGNVKNDILITKTRFYDEITRENENIQRLKFLYNVRRDLDAIYQEEIVS